MLWDFKNNANKIIGRLSYKNNSRDSSKFYGCSPNFTLRDIQAIAIDSKG